MATVPPSAGSGVGRGTAVVDLAGARVIRRLTAAGVESILLKGPATRIHLYGEEARPYRDVDVLVPPVSWPAAVDVLEGMGCQLVRSWVDTLIHSVTWRDPDGIAIDLHRRVSGAQVQDDLGWKVLFESTQTTDVASTTVRIPTRPATLAIVALHAAQHGAEKGKPLADLARALAAAELDEWREAMRVADRLGARESFSAGLGLAPDGARVRQELALAPPTRAAVRLQASSMTYAAAIAQFRELPSAGKRRAVARLLVPSRDDLRSRPSTRCLAARRVTVPLAFAVRWLQVGRKLAGAVRPYLRARRLERAVPHP